MESRRVRVDAAPGAFEFDPASTAALVIDMQNDFGATGGMFDRAGIDISAIRRTLTPTARVLGAARRAGCPVVYLKMGYAADLSDLGAPGSPNRPAMFGKHLVERGLVRESDLIEALDRQASMRVSIGRLAYQLGLLTLDQVMKVLEAQRSNPKFFGTLAVDLGFLTSQQLEQLLETQRETRVPLGQILASLGMLAPEKLDQELRLYLKSQGE